MVRFFKNRLPKTLQKRIHFLQCFFIHREEVAYYRPFLADTIGVGCIAFAMAVYKFYELDHIQGSRFDLRN